MSLLIEDVKKERTYKARTLSRRINELYNAMKNESSEIEISEKISLIKYTARELGDIQDRVLSLADDGDMDELNTWYEGYDDKVNVAIAQARGYIKKTEKMESGEAQVKLAKIKLPVFECDPKKYLKWKNTFERYTCTLNDETKYDYLMASTKGRCNEIVCNKSNYRTAIKSLDSEYGDKHLIMGLLIDEIKSLNPARKGDFKAFEKLTFAANAFRDRLEELGRAAESENTYVLKELESKLHTDDLQKWLESTGNDVDIRTVREFVEWLENQRKLRRISTAQRLTEYPPQSNAKKYLSNPGQSSICGICNEQKNHDIYACPIFINWVPDERWNYVKTNRLCFQCLQSNHRRERCTEPKCKHCDKFHHTLLHQEFGPNNTQYRGTSTVATHQNHEITSSDNKSKRDVNNPARCFLPIVKSTVLNDNLKIDVTTILDSGSELNIINSKLCEKLNLRGDQININIIGVAGEMIKKKTMLVDVDVEDKMGYRTTINCIVLDKTCGNALKVQPRLISYLRQKMTIPQDMYLGGGEIELLIGMGAPRLHQHLSIYGDNNGLMIMETRFGPSLVGQIPESYSGNYECGAYKIISTSITENQEILRIVESEIAGIEKECACQMKTDEELLFETSMRDAWNTDSNGRFTVKLPWKMNPNNLRNNRLQALSRSLALEQKLSKDEKLEKLFEEQMKEMISTNVLRKTEPDYPRRYLPLLAVVNLERDSTKVRICLDSRAKYAGYSLNDALLKGKLKMGDVYEIITGFRSGKYTLIGDIRKMFWQLKIDEEDEKYHGVIYRGQTYVFTRICFGHKPSPPIADMAMLKIAQHGETTKPLASQALIHKRYMDDILDSSSDMEKLTQTRNEVGELIGHFGFSIKEWMSNDERIGNLRDEMKILGVNYNVCNDELSVTLRNDVSLESTFTKRKVLSSIAGCWDPLGICAGVILKGKLIFQTITRLGFSWDQVITDTELRESWDNWISEIKGCNDVLIPRSLLPPISKLIDEWTCDVVGFCDASGSAYACALYLRWKNKDESDIYTRFCGSKSKVTTIKGNTIPRNELCAALLLTRLTSSLLNSLQKNEISKYLLNQAPILFSDSTTVLSWINSPPIRYKPYVKNKVIEIQTTIPTSCWKYVPSSKNKAADILSKGCSPTGLKVVVEGPDILKVPSNTWPKHPRDKEIKGDEIVMEEEVCERNVSAVIKEEALMNLENYSSWGKVLRITAYVLRYIEKLRKKKNGEKKSYYENLTEDEIDNAERYWMRHAQREINEESKSTRVLVPFIDKFGITRVTGRLQQSDVFSHNRKHPIILPAKSRISELIISDIHKKMCHPGHNRVIAESRKKYWIINVRRLAKSIGYHCVVCRRWRGTHLSQIMCDLPASRLDIQCAPFENASVDYFGPVYLKYGRRQKIKGYGVVFVCLTTKAVHLDLTTSLTSDAFLLALRRLISEYGQPRTIRSDNGSNFRGAERELKEMLKRWRDKEGKDYENIQNFLTVNHIQWIFSTPLAPHHNGLVESMVKSVKLALRKLTHDRIMIEEEYRTFLAEVKNLINSRPLWPPNDGDLEDPPITCNDLLIPGRLNRHPHQLDVGIPRTRYEYVQRLVDEWWRIWLRNFLPNLQIRNKWWKKREQLATGDIVLLIDPKNRRGKWPMGKVIDVFPGKDGVVRTAKIETNLGTYDRPITRLSILITKQEYENCK